REILRLAHHAALTGPAVAGAVAEVAEPACRFAGAGMISARLLHGLAKSAAQPLVARQTQHIAHAIVFAPAHDPFATETRIATDNDPCLRPVCADLTDDPRQLLHTARRTVLIGGAQPGTQQVLTTEDVQRQVAVT